MSSWHPKSGPRRKGIHPILLDGGGRFDENHAAMCAKWRREHPEYEPSPACDLDWQEPVNIDSSSPWWAVVFLAILCTIIVWLAYVAF